MVEEKLEIMADPNENQAERRAAGGAESADHAAATANGPSSNGTEAPASVDTATPEESSTLPEAGSTMPDTSAPEGAQGESRPGSEATRKTSADQRLKSGEPRPNTLVPTNGIHTTERRLKRRLHQNRTVMFLVAATLIGILILGEQTDPPDMTAFEQRIAAGQDADVRFEAGSGAAEGINLARVQDAVEAPPARRERVAARGTETSAPNSDPRPTTTRRQRAAATAEPSGARPWDLNGVELAEMERLLARLDLEPSSSDGIVDLQTKRAIRLYQQIAGLPVDGEPSQALLADMREVVKILDSGT